MNSVPHTTVLVVDDEPSICWGIEKVLRDQGYEVLIGSSAEAGLAIAKQNSVSLILLDVRLPGESGLEALPKFRTITADAPIVVMTAFGDLETAVAAVQRGASDYLTKPFGLDDVIRVCQQALLHRSQDVAEREASIVGGSVTKEVRGKRESKDLVGGSSAMQRVFRQIALLADSDLSVLITGETGTGKELVAEALHRHSARRENPYLAVAPVAFNPALLESELFGHVRGAFTGASEDRRGLFEVARGGTVLLDEIGDLPLASQVKLLRVIEQRQFTRVGDVRPVDCDVRVLAATHRDLRMGVAEGSFREDLLYRIGAASIHLPPLRERLDDLLPLCQHVLQVIDYPHAEAAVDAELIAQLQQRPWHGNVREFRNAVEHAAVVARGRRLSIADFPPAQYSPDADTGASEHSLAPDGPIERWALSELARGDESSEPLYERFLRATEPALLRAVLKSRGGNRAAAAECLGMHRATLRERLKRYGIQ